MPNTSACSSKILLAGLSWLHVFADVTCGGEPRGRQVLQGKFMLLFADIRCYG